MPSKRADRRRRRRRLVARRYALPHPMGTLAKDLMTEHEQKRAARVTRTGDQAKDDFLAALGALDEEAFNAAVWMLYQTSKSAGGYRDKVGWLRLRKAAEQLPAIAALEDRFDAAKREINGG
jgi:hypothetical protein